MDRLAIRKAVAIPVMVMLLLAIVSGSGLWAQETGQVGAKKVVMIIAKDNFRDEELQKPKGIFEGKGIEVTIASSSLKTAKGMLGAKVKPDTLYSKIKVKGYDAIVFVGGAGAKQYWNDPVAHRIAQEAVKQDKILGAICIAPIILANAEILTGKKATVWSGVAGKLKDKGAIYTGKPVQVDGKIITANGPRAAEGFGKAILKAMTAKAPAAKAAE